MAMNISMEVDSNNLDSMQSMASSASIQHPRRPPAHRSVSLVHKASQGRTGSRSRSYSPDKRSNDGPSIHLPAEPIKRPSSSPSSLKPLVGKDDSGESSNADKWFDRSNNHASRNSTSFVDNSPPFFLQNSSSEETPSNNTRGNTRELLNNPTSSLALRAGLLHLRSDNSSTEEFRGVIDDLTIENKKLKRKLRTYQKLQDSHLKDQKLFEVRVHGLPTNKKRELEEMLRKFAMGLHDIPGADAASSGGLYNSVNPSLPPAFMNNKSGSSLASNPFADSAYASASASGQGSSAPSSSDIKKKSNSSSAQSRHQNIQTYLHDIPEGLMPREPTAMTEKTRKKLVVRRLEQIFAGKGAVAGNQQPQQQQEVSQLAAKADRSAYESRGQQAPVEGVREASFMPEKTAAKDFAEDANSAMDQQQHSNAKTADLQKQPIPLTKKSLEQRPTRPLDLDPYRAQVPVENFQYIKHLGFSPPGADAVGPPEDGHEWIYLNLLSNMAQLHTINVTPEFVRKAVQERSEKLEISNDGRKIRWKGGRSVTKTSSDGERTPSVIASGSGVQSADRGSPRKRLKVMQGRAIDSESGSKPSLDRNDNKLAYTPLFYHRSSNTDSDDSSESEEEDSNESAFPFPHAGDSSGMTSSGIKTVSGKKQKQRENGPIIFYNNARFCTDLSGDAKTEEAMLYNAYLYHNVVQQAIGTGENRASSTFRSDAKGPLSTAASLPEPMDLDDNPIPNDQELDFPERSPMSSEGHKDRKAYQFEVSGLGGVCPADNFAINVQSLHARTDNVKAPETTKHALPSRYPEAISRILTDNQNQTSRRARTAFHKQVLRTSREELAPSRLPDASCFMPAGDTSPEDEDSSDNEDAMSIEPGSPDAPAPSAARQRMEMDFVSSDLSDGDDEDEEDDDDDSSDDGSLDLLATARAMDPEAVLAKEREYDANMADRLAEEIPAGSSAATAGGGSGFASPGSGIDKEEWEAAKRSLREKEKELGTRGRKRKSSSVAVEKGEE